MAETKKQNIKIECGADFVLPFVWLDENDEPIDLTGATIEAQLREYSASSDGFDFVCSHNDAGGKITLSMPNEVTSLIPYSTGYYDVFVTLPTEEGDVRSLARYGDVEIQDHVTKPIGGTMLYMIGVDEYDDLPETGNISRLYFVYEDRKIYRWNGTNYVATAVGNGIQRIDYVDGGTYRMVFDDGTYFDFVSVPRPMGMHDSTQAYQKLDVVMAANGASYIALVPVPANTLITDTDYWMQITPQAPTVDAEDVAFDYGDTHDDLVTNTGTADAPHLHFKVPRGVTGNESIDDTAGEGDDDVVWSASKIITELKNVLYPYSISEATDLNDLYMPGWYLFGSTTVLSHQPGIESTTGAGRIVIMLPVQKPYSAYRYRHQIYLNYNTGVFAMRTKNGSSSGVWNSWKSYPLETMKMHLVKSGALSDTTVDLNTMDVAGYYDMVSNTNYTNGPAELATQSFGGQSLFVLETSSDTSTGHYTVQMLITGFDTRTKIFIRRKAGNPLAWTAWKKIYDYQIAMQTAADDTVTESFTRGTVPSQGDSAVGTNLKVMSYNICHYNHDTASTYISDNQLLELRKMLARQNPDIIMTQEEDQYIDLADSQESMDYVYRPIFPKVYGVNNTVIHSKRALTNYGVCTYTNGRYVRYACLEIDSKKVLLVSTHPVYGGETAADIAARAVQYEEICKWVNGDISLPYYSTQVATYAPTHTHVIIGMDSNAATADDKANLAYWTSQKNLILANGGRFGWVYTCNVNKDKRSSIDNIIVSNNIIINNFESLSSMDTLLWSDHVPVVADLTLL